MQHITMNCFLRSDFLNLLFLLAGSKAPLVMQAPPDVSTSAVPDLFLTSANCKTKEKERSKEENEQMDKNTLYDIVSSPSKESARLTLKLSRVKIPDIDKHQEFPSRHQTELDHETDLMNNNNNQLSRTTQRLPQLSGEEQANCKQFPFLPNTKETGVVSGAVYDDAEIDTFAEFERIERESTSERERWSKEVQDKGEYLCACAFVRFFMM